MRIQLVTYATPRFRLRQSILGWSAKMNRVVDTVTHWTPEKLLVAGFEDICKDIKLTERGSGFWAWKPFIILQSLESSSEGEIVLYCDTGRRYPYILLDTPLDPFISWMDHNGQDIMPGITIPWNGSMSVWTKHDAFASTGVDGDNVRRGAPIQASFSLWRNSMGTKKFVQEWLSWCVQRQLISDDPSLGVKREASGFKAHRHDQSLLNLCSYKHGIRGMDIGQTEPTFNERDPSQVLKNVWGANPRMTASGKAISFAVRPIQAAEQIIREYISFGKKYE